MSEKTSKKVKFVEAMKEQLAINPKTTALVAVDMHQGHLDPDIGIMLVTEDERKRVLANAKDLFKIVRKYHIPVIHVVLHLRPIEMRRSNNQFLGTARRINEKLEPEERSWQGNPLSGEGWWRPEIMPEVAPGPDDYLINNKKTYSAFLGTDLEHLLRILGVETVALIGINTNTCILCSSFEAANRGFKVIVISDCVASAYGDDLHVSALQNIARCLGWVLTIPEFEEKLEKINRRSSH